MKNLAKHFGLAIGPKAR